MERKVEVVGCLLMVSEGQCTLELYDGTELEDVTFDDSEAEDVSESVGSDVHIEGIAQISDQKITQLHIHELLNIGIGRAAELLEVYREEFEKTDSIPPTFEAGWWEID